MLVRPTKEEDIAVAVDHLEAPKTVVTVDKLFVEAYASRSELRVQRVGIADEDECVPGRGLVTDMIRERTNLVRYDLEVDLHAVSPDDCEERRLWRTGEADLETEQTFVEADSSGKVADDEEGRDVPKRLSFRHVSYLVSAQLTPASAARTRIAELSMRAPVPAGALHE